MPTPFQVTFNAGASGPWHIEQVRPVAGATLPTAERLAVAEGPGAEPSGAWTLRGTASNLRYTSRPERDSLAAVQPGLGRPQAMRAALIPIRKTAAWWDMAQDERQAMLGGADRHIAIGMDYLPAIARRLLHSRDLGEAFDFLTWFEFAPEHEPAFDAMLTRLRDTAEWRYVDREVDIRLSAG